MGKKKVSAKQALIREIQGLNPKITPNIIKAAGVLTGQRNIERLLTAPSKMEEYDTAALGRLKSEDQIRAEQADAFAAVRAEAARAAAAAPALQSAFTGALGSAVGGMTNLAGGDAANMLALMQAGQAAGGETTGATAGLASLAQAGSLQAGIAEKMGIANALAQRNTAEEGYRKERALSADERRRMLMEARSKYPANLLSGISSLLSLAPSFGGSYSRGSGGSTPSGSQTDNTIPVENNPMFRWFYDVNKAGKVKPSKGKVGVGGGLPAMDYQIK